MNVLQAEQLLQVQHGADVDTVKRRYKQLALVYHPDKRIQKMTHEGNSNAFLNIQAAYSFLLDFHELKESASGCGPLSLAMEKRRACINTSTIAWQGLRGGDGFKWQKYFLRVEKDEPEGGSVWGAIGSDCKLLWTEGKGSMVLLCLLVLMALL